MSGETSGIHRAMLEELVERLRDDVAAAVHPDEVAALLEAEGLNDDRIREAYGFATSFALAEELYARIPREHRPAPAPDPSAELAADPFRCALRGVLFALPALAYVLGGPLLAEPSNEPGRTSAGVAVLLLGALTSWAWNQGLSHRAYVWLGLGDRAAAVRALDRGGAAGMLVSAGVATIAVVAVGAAGVSVWVFALGQAYYLAGATLLLVLGRERVLLGALLPLIAGGVAHAAYDLPNAVRAVLLLSSLTAVGALATWCVAREKTEQPRGAAASPPLLDSLPYGLLGLGTGVLVTLAVFAEVLRDGARGGIAASTVLGLTLSMGPAEWLLARFRFRARLQLRRHTQLAAFRSALARELSLGLLAYLAALTLLALVCGALWPYGPAPHGARLAVLLLLGAVLWGVLLLQSFGRPLPAAAICGGAAVAQLSALLSPAPLVAGQLAVCAVAATVLPAAAWLHLSRVTAHR